MKFFYALVSFICSLLMLWNWWLGDIERATLFAVLAFQGSYLMREWNSA
jgi:hypothetical protein